MSTRPNLAVGGLFATPLAGLQGPQAEAINADLAGRILVRPAERPLAQASSADGRHGDRRGHAIRPARTVQACAFNLLL